MPEDKTYRLKNIRKTMIVMDLNSGQSLILSPQEISRELTEREIQSVPVRKHIGYKNVRLLKQ